MKCKCSGNRIFIWYFMTGENYVFGPMKIGRVPTSFLNGALLLIIAANTVHVWNYQERILAGNFASIVGKTRNTSVFFFRLALLFFASGHASTVFFCILLWKFDISDGWGAVHILRNTNFGSRENPPPHITNFVICSSMLPQLTSHLHLLPRIFTKHLPSLKRQVQSM